MRVRMSSVGHYPGIDGTLERTYPTAAPGASVIKMKMRTTMTKLTIKDKTDNVEGSPFKTKNFTFMH